MTCIKYELNQIKLNKIPLYLGLFPWSQDVIGLARALDCFHQPYVSPRGHFLYIEVDIQLQWAEI